MCSVKQNFSYITTIGKKATKKERCGRTNDHLIIWAVIGQYSITQIISNLLEAMEWVKAQREK